MNLNLNLNLCTPHRIKPVARQLLAILLFEKRREPRPWRAGARARHATGARALVHASFTGGDVEEWVADAEELLGWHACENCMESGGGGFVSLRTRCAAAARLRATRMRAPSTHPARSRRSPAATIQVLPQPRACGPTL